jgi:purine-cytosine permease-like protein
MGDHEDYWSWARSHRLLIALVVYAGAGWVAVAVLAGVREYAGLPENLDNGFIAVYLAGFVAMITLLKTHIAGGGPPILHALRVVSLVLMFAASGLLVAHWLNPYQALATAPSVSVYGPAQPTVEDSATAGDECVDPDMEL